MGFSQDDKQNQLLLARCLTLHSPKLLLLLLVVVPCFPHHLITQPHILLLYSLPPLVTLPTIFSFSRILPYSFVLSPLIIMLPPSILSLSINLPSFIVIGSPFLVWYVTRPVLIISYPFFIYSLACLAFLLCSPVLYTASL